jgi:hypothetical protein
MKKVFLAVPTYDGSMQTATAHAIHTATNKYRGGLEWADCPSSLLAMGFNRLLSIGLASGCEYFCMLHADVAPDAGWVDILIDELQAHQADVISAVVPIKNQMGLTSTALDLGDDEHKWKCRRLTMKEVFDLPETFSAKDTMLPDRALLINTGCMLFNLSSPWLRNFPGFQVSDYIQPADCQECTGQTCLKCGGHGWRFEVRSESEDWAFGRWLHRQGLKAVATRKVTLRHFGTAFFTNSVPWGKLDTDTEFVPEPTPKPLLAAPLPAKNDEVFLL